MRDIARAQPLAPPLRSRAPRPAAVASVPSETLELLDLQRQAGNAAIVSLVARPVIQRFGGDEIQVEFIVDRLQKAIHDDSRTRGDVHESFVAVDIEKAAAALEGLTPAQGKAVEAVWRQRDDRSLRDLIAGVAPGRGNDVYLAPDQRRRLLGLLEGTVYEQTVPATDQGAVDAERRQVEQRSLLVDVAHLHAALSDPAARGAVFEILERRGGPPGSARFTSLNDEYKRQWDTGLYVDLNRYLRGRDGTRAEALLEGRTAAATGVELEGLGGALGGEALEFRASSAGPRSSSRRGSSSSGRSRAATSARSARSSPSRRHKAIERSAMRSGPLRIRRPRACSTPSPRAPTPR